MYTNLACNTLNIYLLISFEQIRRYILMVNHFVKVQASKWPEKHSENKSVRLSQDRLKQLTLSYLI